eukprot:2522681-Pyramimonas_sp.AAC.2
MQGSAATARDDCNLVPRRRAATRRPLGGQSDPQARATGGDEAATAATWRPERPSGPGDGRRPRSNGGHVVAIAARRPSSVEKKQDLQVQAL